MNSSTPNFEPWFIPIDVLNIVCDVTVIGLCVIYSFLIILDNTCHTVPMMLVANSCLSTFLSGCALLSMHLKTFENDLKQIYYQDLLCVVRAYIGYVACALCNNSFLLQAAYRYLKIVHPARLYFQSYRFYFLLICLIWILNLLFPAPFVFTSETLYNLDNQICQIYLRLSVSVIMVALCVYVVPITLITFIYFMLVQYVHKMSSHVAAANTLFHAKRELKMVKRTVLLTTILVMVGFPYALFILMSFFTTLPKYHFRIAYVFVDVSMVFVMLTLYQFTEPLKTSMMKRIRRQINIARTIA
ncbi:unnamed protein product [Rotaria sp. Silwood2]|nr:unnamed protein product [Rotaria sp. Silwood2]CAF4544987.1 unnamed protein product [Rotaria sp. Silwood2]